MAVSVAELAARLGARFEGDGSVTITTAAEPSVAGPEDLALAMTPAYAAKLQEGRARVAVLYDGADWRGYGLAAALFVQRPRLALAGITAALDPGPDFASGLHPTALIDPTAELAEDVSVGPYTVIGARAKIGKGARIGPHVTIGADACLGPMAIVHAGVRIGARVQIGARFIAQPNAVIGGDGFSFVTPEKSRVERVRETLQEDEFVKNAPPQPWVRIHSLGAVSIGDDVEVGACSTIDRGTIRNTRIGDGTKIDNLVQIGHNVIIGRDCLICGQAGIAGSVRMGDRVVLAGQAGVGDNLIIGHDVVITGGTKVMANVPDGRVMMGFPATPIATQVEIYKAQRRLPRLVATVAELRETVKKFLKANRA